MTWPAHLNKTDWSVSHLPPATGFRNVCHSPPSGGCVDLLKTPYCDGTTHVMLEPQGEPKHCRDVAPAIKIPRV
ncbi:MAG: hypothetical protein U9P00_14080 [Pseudomonadota bacterium]|nr:hypothetical protein [Pseudomonadota bacterium]